jgi:hypothetical protein
MWPQRRLRDNERCRKGTTIMTKYALDFGPCGVAGYKTVEVVAEVKTSCRLLNLFIPDNIAPSFGLLDIKVKNISQFHILNRAIPCAVFSESTPCPLKLDTAWAHDRVTLVVRNTTPDFCEFQARFEGFEVESLVTLTTVRELGFNNTMSVGRRSTERVFFLGPCVRGNRERGAHATDEAILDFISYYQNQIQVAKDYLMNGRNNQTHEWVSSAPTSEPSVEARVVVQEILRSNGLLDYSKVLEGAKAVDALVAKARLQKSPRKPGKKEHDEKC